MWSKIMEHSKSRGMRSSPRQTSAPPMPQKTSSSTSSPLQLELQFPAGQDWRQCTWLGNVGYFLCSTITWHTGNLAGIPYAPLWWGEWVRNATHFGASTGLAALWPSPGGKSSVNVPKRPSLGPGRATAKLRGGFSLSFLGWNLLVGEM